MATQSRVLAWEIPRTEEPGGLQSTGSQRVGHTEQLSTGSPKLYLSSVLALAVRGRCPFPWAWSPAPTFSGTAVLQGPLGCTFSLCEFLDCLSSVPTSGGT